MLLLTLISTIFGVSVILTTHTSVHCVLGSASLPCKATFALT